MTDLVYVLFFIFFTIALFSIGMVMYTRFKDFKEFRGDKFVETPLAKFLINSVLPPSGSKTEFKYKDYLYVLNRNLTFRDFYFAKIIALVIGVLVGIAIVVTNVKLSYDDCFQISKDVPILMTSSEYKELSNGLSFDNSDADVKLLENNVGSLSTEVSRSKFEPLNAKTCYKYVCNMHDEVSGCFGVGDIAMLLLIPFLSWMIPNFVISGLFKYIQGNALCEYDNLETTISIMRNDKIERIIDALEQDSLYYRNMFYDFEDLYEANPDDAFAVIEQHGEFPNNFKRLIRYLEMLHSQGPEYIKNIIDSNKQQTEQELYDKLMAITNKRLSRLKLICTISFCLAIFRVIVTLFSSVVN